MSDAEARSELVLYVKKEENVKYQECPVKIHADDKIKENTDDFQADLLISYIFMKIFTTGNKVFDSMLYNKFSKIVCELIEENKLRIRRRN